MRVGDPAFSGALADGATAEAELLDAESRIPSRPEALLGILWTVIPSSGLQPQAATITVSTIKIAVRIVTNSFVGKVCSWGDLSVELSPTTWNSTAQTRIRRQNVATPFFRRFGASQNIRLKPGNPTHNPSSLLAKTTLLLLSTLMRDLKFRNQARRLSIHQQQTSHELSQMPTRHVSRAGQITLCLRRVPVLRISDTIGERARAD